jgi:uncharacterized protein (DUF2336 family)
MIVRHFINWVRTAPVNDRADATRGLALAWLHHQISGHDRDAAEGALLMMLDDPSPKVRRALADSFAHSAEAPMALVHALSRDQSPVAEPMLEFSPLLVDADLVDLVAMGDAAAQSAIARRADLPASVGGAIAEVGTAAAALALVHNPTACLVPFSWNRIVERHGHRAEIREALLQLEGLPPDIRLNLATKLSQTLMRLVVNRRWMTADRAERVVGEALDRTAVSVALEAEGDTMQALVRHLRGAGQLSASLILRALMSGNRHLVAHAIAELAELPLRRAEAIFEKQDRGVVEALLARAGLPQSAHPAIVAALQDQDDLGALTEVGGVARLRRRTCERVLEICMLDSDADESLLAILRRFTAEAQREEARLFCDELANELESWRNARSAA